LSSKTYVTKFVNSPFIVVFRVKQNQNPSYEV